MREARTLGSWVIALFLAVMLFWMAAEALAPQPPMRNHLFEVFRDSVRHRLFRADAAGSPSACWACWPHC